jgi:hypothetical protein
MTLKFYLNNNFAKSSQSTSHPWRTISGQQRSSSETFYHRPWIRTFSIVKEDLQLVFSFGARNQVKRCKKAFICDSFHTRLNTLDNV